MKNVDKHAVAKRWGTFALLYLGYMLLFADRTVMNISLAYIGKGFHVGGSRARDHGQRLLPRLHADADSGRLLD